MLLDRTVHRTLKCPCGVFPLALHEQACPTSRRGLRRLGSDPSVECIYTTVDVAAVQLFYLAMRVWDPRHLPVPSNLCGGPSEQKRIVSSSLIRKLN